MKLTKQKGFTAFELTFVVGIVGALALGVALVYAAVHFISKFW